jgi:hypothetical protein
MRHIRLTTRPLIALLAIAVLIPPGVGSAQTVTQGPTMSIDAPSDGEVLKIGQDWFIGGWAVDPRSASGPGITRVDITLDGPVGSGAPVLGQAYYGTPRPDVAALMQRPDLDPSGFLYKWSAPFMQPGAHTVFVEARSTTGSTVMRTVSVMLEGPVRNCSFANPCRTSTTDGYWVDDGGPFVHFERDPSSGGGGGLPF